MPAVHLSGRSGLDMDLIPCPRQPGKLRITRRACALRYRLSKENGPAVPTNEFDIARQLGLERCRSCPVGRLYAKNLKSSS